MVENKVILISALTGPSHSPASRVRIRQYIPRLARRGIVVRDHIPIFGESCGLPSPFKIAARIPALFTSRVADIIWISRELVQGYETFERLLKRPRVMDVDDAIWLSRPLGKYSIPHIARAMDVVVAGNDYLAEYFRQYCRQVHVLPTAIDLARYQPRPVMQEPPAKFVIGWTGLPCNYQFVKPIEAVLARFLREHERAEIMLLSSRCWKYKLLPAEKVHFIAWSPENEAEVLHRFSVGIMPLPDDPWTRGKCSFKMLQYMAVALPVIASPVGMNRQILEKAEIGFAATTDDEWYQSLHTLYQNWSLQERLGRTGRKVVEEFYNADIIGEKLAQIFRDLVT